MNPFYVIWPWRRSPAMLNPDAVFAAYLGAIGATENGPPSADDEKLLANSWKIFDNEVARRNSIDTRAAALMPAIPLSATLVTGVGFTVLKDASLPASARWIILLSFLLSLVYLIRTMLLLFLIHGEISRHTPDPADLVTTPTVLPAVAGAGAVSIYDRRLACKIMSYTVNNYRVNNVWSDALYVAQRAFRNAIIAVVLGGTSAGIVIFSNTLTPIAPPCIV